MIALSLLLALPGLDAMPGHPTLCRFPTRSTKPSDRFANLLIGRIQGFEINVDVAAYVGLKNGRRADRLAYRGPLAPGSALPAFATFRLVVFLASLRRDRLRTWLAKTKLTEQVANVRLRNAPA